MEYLEFERILSAKRMQRYKDAANGDTRKAMALYRYNLRLSQEMFTIVSCFEVALRNAIDSLLVPTLGENWLKDAVQDNRKKASLVPKVGLHRRHIQVSIDVRRRSSMTTKIRARNEASGELKYQPSKHTKSMINYSITMRSVNTNLLIGSICHLLIVAYRPLLYLRNPRAKPFMFGFYNQRFL